MKFPILLLSAFAAAAVAAEPTLTIDAGKAAAKSSPMLYGLMTEEISHSYDGGLYAELIQNRAFLDSAENPVHWSAVQGGGAAATLTLDPERPLNASLPVSLKVNVTAASPAVPAGVANAGYWGIPVKPSTTYQASLYAKAAPGFSGPLTVAIQSADGTRTYAKATIPQVTSDWKQYPVTLTTPANAAPTTQARFALLIEHPGTLWLDLVSLFPPTWKDRPNGLRQDLMQMLVDLKPAFLRFPGGNYLEGDTIAKRFDWKKTLGPLTKRGGHPGPWGYRSADGMGMIEFLQWCEDMGAEPVLAVYAGYSLQGEHVTAGPGLEPYVQDALDEIEYVTGPVSSKWGAERARDGHPAPFPLKYVEIGNEDFFDGSGSYDGRFTQIRNAIKAKYPQIECISTMGLDQPANRRVHSSKPDAIDEHYYRSADEFLRMASDRHYEKYDRNGPKIFVGEWAAYETPFVPWDKRSLSEPPTPNMKAALGDAAFMADMERNSDVVLMQCYAPLFVNINPGARQWRPNMIGYDALRSYGSPSYYAFQMFSRTRGDEILKASLADSPLQTSVVRDSKTGAIYVKVVNPTSTPQPLDIDLKGIRSIGPTTHTMTLAADPSATNTIDEPTKVAPVTSQMAGAAPKFRYTFAPSSITVLKIDSRS
jgi:alpha-N-arabinofuranosidase